VPTCKVAFRYHPSVAGCTEWVCGLEDQQLVAGCRQPGAAAAVGPAAAQLLLSVPGRQLSPPPGLGQGTDIFHSSAKFGQFCFCNRF